MRSISKVIFAGTLCGLFVLGGGCSVPGYQKSSDFLKEKAEAEAAQTPPPPPPPKTYWGCKVSNGAGLIFRGIGDDIYEARNDARRPCERQYRGCFILDCVSGVKADFKSAF